jgi:hypothetical protein
MGEMKTAYTIWPESLEENGYLEGLDVDRRILLKCNIQK